MADIVLEHVTKRYPDGFEAVRNLSDQHLRDPWTIAEEERFLAGRVWPRSRRQDDTRGDAFISGLSGYGRYLRRQLRGDGPRISAAASIRRRK